MKPSWLLPPERDRRWELARQIGVSAAVTQFPETPAGVDPWEFDPLLRLNNAFESAGFDLAVIEDRPPMDKIMLGKPGRDEEIEHVKTLLRSMGQVGISIWCWAWMPLLSWRRTSDALPDRGGSLVTGYDHEQMERGPLTSAGRVSEDELWANVEGFLHEVVPVAEEAGVKMALHPDDPPLSPVRGIGRIFTSVEAFDRVLELYPSDNHGITLGQGNFAATGVDVPETIRHFGDHVHFAHFRDVEGTREKFRETWHDDGPTDMLAAMEAYHDVGFDGPMRPDHVPTMASEDNENPGYETLGRLFAIGYMKGLAERAQD